MTSPEDMLACAERIAQTTPEDDSLHRAITSRAYYAAYHAARNFHNGLAIPGSVGAANGVHEQLISQLSSPGLSPKNDRHVQSKTLGRMLRSLMSMRVDADYRMDLACNKGREALALAHSIVCLAK